MVGVKPTYGAVSRYGLVAASSLDQVGPFTTTVADAALALEVIGGHDPMDTTSIPEPAPSLVEVLDCGVEGLRNVVQELAGDGIDGDVLDRLQEAAAALEKAGATVGEASVPAAIYGLSAYYLIAPAEASSNLAATTGSATASGRRPDHRRRLRPHPHRRLRCRGEAPHHARHLRPVGGLLRRLLRQGVEGPHLILQDFARAYERFDLLLAPTSPCEAFRFGDKTADPMTMYLNDVCTIPSNLSGQPAMSVPFGTGDEACRSGSRSWPRRSASPRCSEPPPPSRRRRAMTATERTDWETVIGLEVHVELATATKMFCGCQNTFGSEPNTNVCPCAWGCPGRCPW